MIIRQATLADAAAIAKVRVDTWRTACRGIIPEEYLSNMSYEKSKQRVKTNQFELSGVMIDEVAYGWLNIRALLEEQHT